MMTCLSMEKSERKVENKSRNLEVRMTKEMMEKCILKSMEETSPVLDSVVDSVDLNSESGLVVCFLDSVVMNSDPESVVGALIGVVQFPEKVFDPGL